MTTDPEKPVTENPVIENPVIENPMINNLVTENPRFQDKIKLSKLLCDLNAPHPTAERVDSLGNYVLWEGCTIIMPVDTKSRGFMETIYDKLKDTQIIRDYVSLLPPLSYHVTLRPIRERCKCQNGKEYNEYIVAKYKKMYELDRIFQDSKIDLIEFDFDIKTMDKCSYAGLSLRFEDAKTNEKTLRDLEDIATEYLDLPLKKQSWHLSLGYFHTLPGKKERKMIKTAVKEVLNVNGGKYTLGFTKPMVCYFKDMTHFEHI